MKAYNDTQQVKPLISCTDLHMKLQVCIKHNCNNFHL